MIKDNKSGIFITIDNLPMLRCSVCGKKFCYRGEEDFIAVGLYNAEGICNECKLKSTMTSAFLRGGPLDGMHF